MITHNIDARVEDRFTCNSKNTYPWVVASCMVTLIAELLLVLVFLIDDGEASKTLQWQVNMKRSIFCTAVMNLMIIWMLTSMDESKVVLKFFRDLRSSRTVKLLCFGVFLLLLSIFGAVVVSFWLFQ